MLAYRRQESAEDSRRWVVRLKASLADAPFRVSEARDLVVALGDFETAVADARFATCDDDDAASRRLREVTGAASESFVALLGADHDGARAARRRAVLGLGSLEPPVLPASLRRRTPEGFSRYCLYPEQYVASAVRLAEELRPAEAVVIGLRSIGTTLSSVVEATLKRRGVDVQSFTLRPRGHPFERDIAATPELSATFARRASSALFVVVDEGPGLSGSSFACAASALRGLGVRDRSIVLMPSWDSNGDGLLSQRARAVWAAHRRFVDPFEPRVARAEGAIDVSAGRWRDQPWANRATPPTVPRHERRKFVLKSGTSLPRLTRFAGFDRYGAAVRHRAIALAASRQSPPVASFAEGFLELELVRGVQLTAADGEKDLVIDHLSRYCAFVAEHFSAETPADLDALVEMTCTNAREAFGPDCQGMTDVFRRRVVRLDPRHTIVDGRMAPHEWVRDGVRILKTDAFDHGDDDFFPGPTDIAWDLAGAAVEFQLSAGRRARLLDVYARHSGDRTVKERLPLYETAYLAFRLGYATLSAAHVEERDSARFLAQMDDYRGRFRRALESLER